MVYEGDFLPLEGGAALPGADLKVNQTQDPEKMWVESPSSGGPVPVILVRRGVVLVPAEDREALAARWASDPAELNEVRGQ